MRWRSKSLLGAGCVLLLLACSGMPRGHADDAGQQPKLSKAAGPASGSYLLCDGPDLAPAPAPIGLHPPSQSAALFLPAAIGVTSAAADWQERPRAPPAS